MNNLQRQLYHSSNVPQGYFCRLVFALGEVVEDAADAADSDQFLAQDYVRPETELVSEHIKF